MADFFRFPHTPHIAWLGEGSPRDDKLLAPHEVVDLLASEVLVEEKIDGANVGLSVSPDGDIRAQNRGGYLERGLAHEQFRPLWPWLDRHRDHLFDALGDTLTLFGEWCYACHSVQYDRLPDWFLCFDIYDREAKRFWSADRRNTLLAEMGVEPTPEVARGRFTVRQLAALIGRSVVGTSGMEGIVVRAETDGFVTARGKLVAAQFTQQIEEHWSRRPVQPNVLAPGVALWP